jgi:hypothetical protein
MLSDDSSRCWRHTVQLLGTSSILPLTNSGRLPSSEPVVRQRRKIKPYTTPAACAVRVIDRPGPTVAIVAWSDPTACYYGDQTWQAGIARHPGICAACGKTIRRGDAVYMPRRKPIPANADAMILAVVVQNSMSPLPL